MNRRDFFRRTALAGAALKVGSYPMTRTIAAAPGESFRAGFAERDITPEIGMEKPGGYGKSFLDQFHDPCKIRVAVFENGRDTVALVGTDSLIIPRQLVLDARREIHERCGIDPNAVLVGASHSHSSGPVGMVQPGEYDHASELVQELAYEKSSCADPGYLELVRRQIVDGVCAGYSSRREARCGIGSGHEGEVAFNRRFRMKNGLTYTHPGKGNPDIIEPAGPIDPEVGVIGAWDTDGNLMGCIVNYACHATTSPPGISANWIYYLEKTIQGAMGTSVPVVFLQGACGDVTQVDNLSPYANPGGEEWAQIVGGRVGAESVRVLLSVEPGILDPLVYDLTVLEIPRRSPSPERVRECLELVKRDPQEVGTTRWTFAKEILMLDALIEKEPVVDVEVQVVQVGPAVFVTNPAEFFCQLGLDIKAGSKFQFTYPVELANGCVGYVPTEEALGPNGGGYETRLTAYSNLVPTAGPQMVEAGLQLVSRLEPGSVPTPPEAPPFSGPWSYGNVPPELD